jgi:hypothetical protein
MWMRSTAADQSGGPRTLSIGERVRAMEVQANHQQGPDDP